MKDSNCLTFIERLSQIVDEQSYDRHENGFSIIDSIKDNLQSLLNSQKIVFTWDETSRVLQNSILNYGLNSIQGFLYDSYQSAEKLCVEIEDSINLFEKRLSQVRVTMKNSDVTDHLLFLVEGVFIENYEKFEVQFQTKLNHHNSNFTITMKNLERI